MREWTFEVTEEAESDLEKLDFSVRTRALKKIKWFRENFEQIIPLPLRADWQGFFKLRVGDYRVVYEVEVPKKLVTIHYINRRDKIYKRKKPRK